MTVVKFPAIAARRIAARRPRRSKNGTPEERAAKAAATCATTATVAAIRFDPATWLERCGAAGMEVVHTSSGSLLFGIADADHDQMRSLLTWLNSTPGAKDEVKKLLRRSAAVS
jgi:hypothetical protein